MNHTTTTDPLVERYVAAVAARLPADQRQDVADELPQVNADPVANPRVPIRSASPASSESCRRCHFDKYTKTLAEALQDDLRAWQSVNKSVQSAYSAAGVS